MREQGRVHVHWKIEGRAGREQGVLLSVAGEGWEGLLLLLLLLLLSLLLLLLLLLLTKRVLVRPRGRLHGLHATGCVIRWCCWRFRQATEKGDAVCLGRGGEVEFLRQAVGGGAGEEITGHGLELGFGLLSLVLGLFLFFSWLLFAWLWRLLCFDLLVPGLELGEDGGELSGEDVRLAVAEVGGGFETLQGFAKVVVDA